MKEDVILTSGGNPAQQLRDVVEKHIDKAAQHAALRVANHIAGRVRQTILGQEQAWKKLTPRYARWKQAHGLDARILRATGDYVNSIVPRKVENSYVVSPGDYPHKTQIRGRKPSTIPLKTIGAWLEFGTRKMPARPHWLPVIQQTKKNVNEIRDRFFSEVRQEIDKQLEISFKGEGQSVSIQVVAK